MIHIQTDKDESHAYPYFLRDFVMGEKRQAMNPLTDSKWQNTKTTKEQVIWWWGANEHTMLKNKGRN